MTDEPQETGTAMVPTAMKEAMEGEVASLAKQLNMTTPGSVLAEVLVSTAFSGDKIPTFPQMIALMVVAKQYGLNPFTKEIYAFPDKNRGIVPIVSVDGWTRIVNEHEQMAGIEFRYSEEMVDLKDIDPKVTNSKLAHAWIEAVISRHDRDKPTVVREYFDEVYRLQGNYPGPWQSHPKRFHRHKTLIQGARLAFGFGGIFDQDEGERILENETARIESGGGQSSGKPAPSRPQRKTKPAEQQQPELEPERDQRGTPIEDAEYEPMAEDRSDQREQISEERQPVEEKREPARETRKSEPAAVDTPPGFASPGTITFLTRKAEAKGYETGDLLERFELKVLNGITEEKANEILQWIKGAPEKAPAA